MPHTQKTFLIGCTITLLAGISGYGIYALFASCRDAVDTFEHQLNQTLLDLRQDALRNLKDTLKEGHRTCWQLDKVLTRTDRILPKVRGEKHKLHKSLVALNASLKHPDLLEKITLQNLYWLHLQQTMTS